MNKMTNTLLHLNGWVAVLIGSLIVIDPVSLLSSYGLQSNLSTGLLSELRAPGGLLIVSGLIIVGSAVNIFPWEHGLQLSVMVYGSYGGVRLLGLAVDGLPPQEILIATGIELILCGLSILVLRRQRVNVVPMVEGHTRFLSR